MITESDSNIALVEGKTVEMITSSDEIQPWLIPAKKAKCEKGLIYLLEDGIVVDSPSS